MPKLTVAKIKSFSKPGLYGDGETLYLRIAKGGTKSWVQRVTIDGTRRDMGLGPYPVVSLAKARRKAFENRVAIYDGRNPVAEKRQAKAPTFQVAAEKTFKMHAERLKSEKGRKMWWAQLNRHALRKIGSTRVDRISREDVLRILTPIWTSKPEAARKVRQHIRATLQWALAHGYVEVNVAGEAIDGALPTMPAVKAHLRALPYADVGRALEAVEQSTSSASVQLCFRFIVLTAVRNGEARGATWSEIDMDARVWRIPAERMKTRSAEHRVPLSDAAIAVLEQALPLRDGSDLVFPSPSKKGATLSDMVFTKLLRSTGLAERTTVHGFRSSFRDWCADTGKPREIAEAALAHTVGGVEGAYFRSDLFERRRALMDRWADFVTGEAGKVVRLRAGHA